jgi:hypothetical protein
MHEKKNKHRLGVMKLPRSGDSGHKRTQLFLYPLLPEVHPDHHLVLDRHVPHNLKASQKAQDLHITDKKVLKFNGLSDTRCRHAASQSLQTIFVETFVDTFIDTSFIKRKWQRPIQRK